MITRTVLLIPCTCLLATLASAQFLSVGVKGGVTLTPVTDSQNLAQRGFLGSVNFMEKRYAIGPTIETKLPWNFAVEADALYRSVRVDIFAAPNSILYDGNVAQTGEHANVWEIPLLLKRRFRNSGLLHPYVSAGATLRHVSDLDATYLQGTTLFGPPFQEMHATFSSDAALRTGVTVGGGVSFRMGPLHAEPELRFTHWTSQHYLAETNELQLVVGLLFGIGK